MHGWGLGGDFLQKCWDVFSHYKYRTTASPSFKLGVQLESRHNKDANANGCKLSRLFVINSKKEDTRGMKEKVWGWDGIQKWSASD